MANSNNSNMDRAKRRLKRFATEAEQTVKKVTPQGERRLKRFATEDEQTVKQAPKDVKNTVKKVVSSAKNVVNDIAAKGKQMTEKLKQLSNQGRPSSSTKAPVKAVTDTSKPRNDITFKEFYDHYWLDAYKAGQTTNTNTPPITSTVFQTENMFRLHILPMFGKYSLKYLMSNKQLVLNKLTNKANEYANFKVIQSYVNPVFDWAEELEMIEGNRLKKVLVV